MSTDSVPRTDSAEPNLRPDDLKQDLGHIRDLVFLRDLLQARGATASEMWEYQTTIDLARGELAESAKRFSRRYAAAA